MHENLLNNVGKCCAVWCHAVREIYPSNIFTRGNCLQTTNFKRFEFIEIIGHFELFLDLANLFKRS